jgi:hypothetical protein
VAQLLELDFRERQADRAAASSAASWRRRRPRWRALARLQQHRELACTHERSLYDGLMPHGAAARHRGRAAIGVDTLRRASGGTSSNPSRPKGAAARPKQGHLEMEEVASLRRDRELGLGRDAA